MNYKVLTVIGRNTYSAALLATFFLSSVSHAKTEVPVFLFSGQSNMVGMGSVNDLSSEQKETIGDIMINVDADCDQSKKGKWLPLSPGFGNGSNNFGPELLFGITLADSMPDQKIAFIKNAVNGSPLGASSGYLPPSSNNGTGGNNYRNMMNHIDRAMESFHEAFDTSEYTPKWAGFIWLQGESDAMQGGNLSNSYETNLENLIGDIREMSETPDLPAILPLITKASFWTDADKIRGADVALRERMENVDTVETKDFNLPDGMHYDAAGLIEIGYYAAIRWLDMDFEYKDPVTVTRHRTLRGTEHVSPLFKNASIRLFDLSGRTVGMSRNVTDRRTLSPAIFIGESKRSTQRNNSGVKVLMMRE